MPPRRKVVALEVLDDHARGLFLGLLLGDALSATAQQEPSPNGTCLSQLACFTLEGLIRASVRMTEKGICHPPSVVWHSWRRWAHLQGLRPPDGAPWPSGSEPWPDGWLCKVDLLSIRRGSAPATVTALRSSNPPPNDARPRGHSGGHHALTRSLTAALYGQGDEADTLARELAALTHGHPEAIAAAGIAARAAAVLIRENVDRPTDPLEAIVTQAAEMNLSTSFGTAPHALLHGAQAAAAGAEFAQVLELSRPHGAGAVTTAAALFGALRGVFALPQQDLARLELAWVGDVLVHDALAQLREGVSDAGQTSSISWERYPGW